MQRRVGSAMIGLSATLGAALALGACASSESAQPPPAWFTERMAQGEDSFPRLQDVPNTTIANTDAAHWADLRADLETARAEVRASPRSEPAPPTDPEAFKAEALAEIERTRAEH